MTAKEKLRLVVDGLTEAEAEDALRYLARRESGDALVELLEQAPIDDEPASKEEDAAVREAWAEYRRGETTPLDQLRRDSS